MMSNQNQFVRRTAAVLMTFGFIVILLPGRAAAQDLSTGEKRAAWVIEQRRGESINPNAKFGAAKALARLALNPNDTEVIGRITHFYDRVSAGTNGQQFSYPGVAWVLGKYWDKFTPAERDHLKARLKGFSDLLGHGTENHAIMKCVAAYLFALAARASDGSFALVYTPVTHELKINLSRLNNKVEVRWFNPANGQFTKAGQFPNSETRTFISPGDNGTGTTDWLLVLQTNL